MRSQPIIGQAAPGSSDELEDLDAPHDWQRSRLSLRLHGRVGDKLEDQGSIVVVWDASSQSVTARLKELLLSGSEDNYQSR